MIEIAPAAPTHRANLASGVQRRWASQSTAMESARLARVRGAARWSVAAGGGVGRSRG
jgi:hypothetical protein